MENLAIIGTGIAGMGCAHHLQHKYNITLFEQNGYVGGHTNTVTVDEDGKDIHIDTGFMVFNKVTYPNLCRLFDEIKAPVKKTDMSFSVQYLPEKLEYCGSGLNGLFAQRTNVFNLRFIRMLMQISRFNSESVKMLDDPAFDDMSLGEYISKKGFGEDMLWKYLIPMSSAVWSTPMELMLDFPVKTLVRFFYNHGFLGLNTQHQWYTLHGGSRSYRDILIKPFRDRIHTGNKVVKVSRPGKGVRITLADGSQLDFDRVIMASHADQSLRMLDQPAPAELALLAPFKYQYNLAVLHTDVSVMPRNKKTWSSWNYRIESHGKELLPTTIYWMNRLQQVSVKKDYFVSINPVPGSIDESRILEKIDYEHPLFDVPAIKAQVSLQQLNQEGPVYFCGSYFRYGFHEDAYTSALELCNKL